MNNTSQPIDPEADARQSARQFNSKVGLILFAVYLLLYAGFVLINAFLASWMETIVLAGLNLAIVYGFGLIITAVILALVYGSICKSEPIEAPPVKQDNSEELR